LNHQPAWWRGSALGQSLDGALAREERRAIRAVGAHLQTGLLHHRMWFSELNVMALALRREVTVQRLVRAASKEDPAPYTGEPLPPFEFIHAP
jgi:hypothetical protein